MFCIENEDINTMLVDGQEVTTTVNRHPTLGAIKKVVRQLTSAN